MSDLVLAGGRVVDPARGIDGRLDVAVTGGLLTAAGEGRPVTGEAGPAAETVDASGLVLVPGLVDLHTHLYEGVSHYGIDPDANCLRRGVTTAVDAGSSGAQTFPGFRRYVIERAQTRVLAFLHVNAMKILFGSAVINGLLAPFLLVAILILAADPKAMNNQPSSRLGRIVVGLTTILMFAAAVGMFVF